MKKQLSYILWILFWVIEAVAVTPGRLDSILTGNKAGAASVAAGAVKSTKTYDTGMNWFYIIFKLVILLVILSLIIYALVWFLKKIQFRRGFGGSLPPELYKVIGMAPMSYNKQFMLVKFYDTIYLLGMSENSMVCMDKIDDPEKITDIESLVPLMPNMPDKFAKMLKKKIKQVDKEVKYED